jgi:hypothetical protein
VTDLALNDLVKPMIFCAFIVCSPYSNECLIYRTTDTRYSAPHGRN